MEKYNQYLNGTSKVKIYVEWNSYVPNLGATIQYLNSFINMCLVIYKISSLYSKFFLFKGILAKYFKALITAYFIQNLILKARVFL